MTLPSDNMAFAQLASKIAPDSTLLRAWPLHGGISAQVTALEIQHSDGHTQKLIVRQHGSIDRTHNPNIARDEFRLLQTLHAAGLPAPAPVYLDTSGELFATPVIVVAFIEGASVFALTSAPDLILQFAAQLAMIHRVDCMRHDLSFLPRQEDTWAAKLRKQPLHLDDSRDERRIRDTLAAAWPLPQCNVAGLLHGDYWPGNVLWRDGRLVGVIDWEDAATGDPLADVANSRLEILWAFGGDAMRDFTQHYASLAPTKYTNLPYWDLCAALRHAPNISKIASDDTTAIRMWEQHRAFVAQAFAELATS